MATLWQKTLFYLGLVDEEQAEQIAADEAPVPAHAADQTVRTVAPPRPPQPVPPARPGAVAGRRVEPPPSARRRISSNPAHAEAGVVIHESGRPQLQPLPPPGTGQDLQILEARAFSDAQTLADSLRQGRPVVLDLRSTEPEMVRRLVDFSSGLTYALDGKMSKIAQGVILVTPPGVTLDIASRRRLAEQGLYARPIED